MRYKSFNIDLKARTCCQVAEDISVLQQQQEFITKLNQRQPSGKHPGTGVYNDLSAKMINKEIWK